MEGGDNVVWIILKTVADIVLAAINVWCVFNICELKNTIWTKEMELRARELHLKEREMAKRNAEEHARLIKILGEW